MACRAVDRLPSIRSGVGRAAAIALTCGAMLAFAANSVLCRVALGLRLIDPASFAAIRVITAAAVLSAIVAPRWAASPSCSPTGADRAADRAASEPRRRL